MLERVRREGLCVVLYPVCYYFITCICITCIAFVSLILITITSLLACTCIYIPCICAYILTACIIPYLLTVTLVALLLVSVSSNCGSVGVYDLSYPLNLYSICSINKCMYCKGDWVHYIHYVTYLHYLYLHH